MTNSVYCISLLLLSVATAVSSWKAVPASQAMYALRSKYYGPKDPEKVPEIDELLPRDHIHSIFKFGWCTPDSIQRVFLRKRTNITLSDWQSTQAAYIYLLEEEGTYRFAMECVVMTVYVPRIHLFRRSRLPLYYCQGHIYFVWKLTYTKLEIHEFYLQQSLNLPANFVFEFYHAAPL